MTSPTGFAAIAAFSAHCASVETSVKAWLEAQATGDTFGFAAGGTTIVSELRISEQNEEAATLSITCTYYPQVVATPGV